MMLKEDNEQNNDNDQKQNGQNNHRDVGHKFDASIHGARAMSGTTPTFTGHHSREAGQIRTRSMHGVGGIVETKWCSTSLNRIKVILKVRKDFFLN